jgi:hypothetical protein
VEAEASEGILRSLETKEEVIHSSSVAWGNIFPVVSFVGAPLD